MTRPLPPYPGADLNAWASQLYEYLTSREQIETERLPQPVQLGYKNADSRAVTPGTLMYDPELQKPVVSDGFAWRVVGLDEALVSRVDYEDLVLDGTWQPFVPTAAFPPLPSGVYTVIVTGTVLGTGGGASYQFRVTVDGAPVGTSEVYPIGNGEYRTVSIVFAVTAGSGAVQLEATGTNVTASEMAATFTRAGG